MTETVVVEKAHTVIQEQKPQTIVTQNIGIQTIVAGMMGPSGVTTIGGATDVDKTQLTDGAVLVYAANTATWRATTKLDNQILEAGQF